MWKLLTELKEKNCLKNYKKKYIPNLLLKRLVEMYPGNKIKVKINNQISENTIN